jgi:hypothetical protein
VLLAAVHSQRFEAAREGRSLARQHHGINETSENADNPEKATIHGIPL